MAAKCTAVADTLEKKLKTLLSTQADMVDVSALLCEDYSRRVDRLHGAIDAIRRLHLYGVRTAGRLHTKALDAEAHAAEVTAGQLCALASMCEGNLAITHSASFMAYMESSLHAFLELVADGDRIAVSTHARLDGDGLADLLSRLSILAEVSVCLYFPFCLFFLRGLTVRLNCLQVVVHIPYVATGAHVRTYALKYTHDNRGLALTQDGTQFAVSNSRTHQITVYDVVSGARTATFGGNGNGAGPGQFDQPFKLCTTPRDTLLAAEYVNQRVQEVTFSGVHIRYIGVGAFGAGIYGIACNDAMIAVTESFGSAPNRILVFDYITGELLRQFAAFGSGDGQIGPSSSVRFTPDNQHIIVADTYSNRRLSMFTVDGAWVKHIGVGVLGGGACDVDFAADGRIIVPDCWNHRVCVFTPDGAEAITASWGTEGTSDGQFAYPNALSVSGDKLFVLDMLSARVQVFD